MNRIAAEIAIEIRMLFQHGHRLSAAQAINQPSSLVRHPRSHREFVISQGFTAMVSNF